MNDKVIIENILKFMRRGKWELQGDEALAFSQCFEYLVKKLKESETKPIDPKVKNGNNVRSGTK